LPLQFCETGGRLDVIRGIKRKTIMKKRRIGRSGLMVSEICLGTMTFGSTCDEQQAMRIMDRAFDAGVDFLDTAEVYPVPADIPTSTAPKRSSAAGCVRTAGTRS
jgi:hypothetical protein